MQFSPGDVISYREMCNAENANLQRGMNFRTGIKPSVFLMSRRPGAPYNDSVIDDGKTIIYEGHDMPKRQGIDDPKALDQPLSEPSHKLTQNGLFFKAAKDRGESTDPATIHIYEKIITGIWVYNGEFALCRAYTEHDGIRNVCKFRCEILETSSKQLNSVGNDLDHTRVIPSSVKIEVWKRDKGQCRNCGAGDNLHFDHIIPFSRGGSSLVASNIQLLCARHNLLKSDRIE